MVMKVLSSNRPIQRNVSQYEDCNKGITEIESGKNYAYDAKQSADSAKLSQEAAENSALEAAKSAEEARLAALGVSSDADRAEKAAASAEASADRAEEAAEVATNAASKSEETLEAAEKAIAAAENSKVSEAKSISSAATANQAANDAKTSAENAANISLVSNPIGTIVLFSTLPVPTGWLSFTGGNYSKDDYPEFFLYWGTETLPNWSSSTPDASAYYAIKAVP